MKTKKNTKSAKPTTKTKAAPRAPKLIDAIGAGELDNVTGGASVPYGHLLTASGASASFEE